MTFLLSSRNAFNYLIEHGLCDPETQPPSKIESKKSKNFNLLLRFPNNRYLLIKQEYFFAAVRTSNEFYQEWRIYQWLKDCPEVSHIREIVSEAIYFDPISSIIIFNYLDDYCDIDDFYSKENNFSTAIAEQIGSAIASIHRITFDREDYKKSLFPESNEGHKNPNFLQKLEMVRPEIFAQVTSDNLKFFKLYQRYDSFRQAVAKLQTTYQHRSLIHNDLKLNNILLHNQWQEMISNQKPSANNMVRVIDWEKSTWGDPAFDIGRIIASYLDKWLSSLIISTDINVETALQLAKIPLQNIQPSINALIQAYYHNFPEITFAFPDFLTRVIQFTGLALLEQIQVNIEDHRPVGNIGICTLQVAKNLLCFPEQSLSIIFGTTEKDFQIKKYSMTKVH